MRGRSYGVELVIGGGEKGGGGWHEGALCVDQSGGEVF